jgi:hypothetical protein
MAVWNFPEVHCTHTPSAVQPSSLVDSWRHALATAAVGQTMYWPAAQHVNGTQCALPCRAWN